MYETDSNIASNYLFVFASFSACQDDLPAVGPDEGTSASFPMTKSVSELDENLLLIQTAMQRVDSVTPFWDRFTQLYGTPLWQYALPMGEEKRDISYLVPVYKEEIPNMIHTIWFLIYKGIHFVIGRLHARMNIFVLTNRILSSTS